MDFFATLGVALGLAMLAGLNVYLTIFITGLAVKLDWFGADSQLATALEGFGHPAVIAVALGLYLVQFLVDKVPWLDSLWDSIHTFLKPAGGALLALTSLGPEAGTLSHVFVAMLAIAGSLLTHGVKAGTRLTINTSPEPFSNIGVSVAEDLLVIGGYWIILHHPATGFFIFAVALALFAYLTPRSARAIRAILWLIWRKIRVPAGDKTDKQKDLPHKLHSEAEALLLDEFGSEGYEVEWAVPCVTGRVRSPGRLCRNLFGELVAIRERGDKLFFFGSRNFKKFIEVIELGGAKVSHEAHFISEGLVIQNKANKTAANFRFHRGQAELAGRLEERVKKRIAISEPLVTEEEEDDEKEGSQAETSDPPTNDEKIEESGGSEDGETDLDAIEALEPEGETNEEAASSAENDDPIEKSDDPDPDPDPDSGEPWSKPTD